MVETVSVMLCWNNSHGECTNRPTQVGVNYNSSVATFDMPIRCHFQIIPEAQMLENYGLSQKGLSIRGCGIVPIAHYARHVGNLHWDEVRIGASRLGMILQFLHRLGSEIKSAPTELWAWWETGSPLQEELAKAFVYQSPFRMNDLCEELLETVILHRRNCDAKMILADALDESGMCGQSMRWAAKNRNNPQRLSSKSYRWSMSLPFSIYYALKKEEPFRSFFVSTSQPELRYTSARSAWLHFIHAFKIPFDKRVVGYSIAERKAEKLRKRKKIQAVDDPTPSLFE